MYNLVTDVYNYFRAILQSQEKSNRALELTSDAVRLNPANYTVWQYRYICVCFLHKYYQNDQKDICIFCFLQLILFFTYSFLSFYLRLLSPIRVSEWPLCNVLKSSAKCNQCDEAHIARINYVASRAFIFLRDPSPDRNVDLRNRCFTSVSVD